MNSDAKKLIEFEATSLTLLANNIPKDFEKLAKKIADIKGNGRVVLSGVGKSGYIARKIAASFSSTGTAAIYIHPSEASHGDLGNITENDIVMLLSNSGETKEIFDIIRYCKRFGIKIASMTMKVQSTIALASDYLLNIPFTKESSFISAPTTSALMMLALGDALMTSVYSLKGFTIEDFSVYHPGGKIGARLLKVSDLMIPKDEAPLVKEDAKIVDVILKITKYKLGCVVVTSDLEDVVGIITDGDLTRHMESGLLDRVASEIMTKNPKHITSDKLASQALATMNDFGITSLLVFNEMKFCGIVQIHDILRAGVE